ncbi:hypothetical protein GCM10010191_03000 [Actinomadura vinacea]|uniref:Intersectin-EH binding protein Ibp1 n=1 Tax=Actinomadura vinacea TaxID=115336 RepID=A0ABN3IB34_9ACTN
MKKVLLVSAMSGFLGFGILGLSATAASADNHAGLAPTAKCPPGHLEHPITGECIALPPGPDSAR